jgi:hypothetical protein
MENGKEQQNLWQLITVRKVNFDRQALARQIPFVPTEQVINSRRL